MKSNQNQTLRRLVVSAAIMAVILSTGCGRNFSVKQMKDLSSTSEVSPVLLPTTFKIGRTDIKLIPYRSLENKIRFLINGLPDSALQPVQSIHFQMSDYDFSQGISIESTWNGTKMGAWITALLPICQSAQYRQQFPFPAGAYPFIQKAYGRTKQSADEELVNSLLNLTTADNTEKSDLLCLILMSSVEFVGM